MPCAAAPASGRRGGAAQRRGAHGLAAEQRTEHGGADGETNRGASYHLACGADREDVGWLHHEHSMLARALIERKRDGGRITPAEWRTLMSQYATDEVPDYQMAALAMAIYFNGLDRDEIGALTPGRKADIVLHDTDRPEWRPLLNVMNQLVWSADGRGVHTVLVDGKVVVEPMVGGYDAVNDIALLPEWRGQGLGHQVLQHLMTEARAQGRSVTIYVEAGNPARRLYDRLGFLPEGQREGVHQFMRWHHINSEALESCNEQA